MRAPVILKIAFFFKTQQLTNTVGGKRLIMSVRGSHGMVPVLPLNTPYVTSVTWNAPIVNNFGERTVVTKLDSNSLRNVSLLCHHRAIISYL